jgi:glutamyl-tRNA reductase
MTEFNDIIDLLKKRKTAPEELIRSIQDKITKYQKKREDFYVKTLFKQYKDEGCAPKQEETDRITERIICLVQDDVKEYIDKQTKQLFDIVLDAINNKTVFKQKAYDFLVILQSTRVTFDLD